MERGCEGKGVAFGHFLCPLSGDFDQKLAPNFGFVIPRKGYFYQIWTISSPKRIILTKNTKKPKKTNAASMTVPLHSPSTETLIPALMETCYAYTQPLSFVTDNRTLCEVTLKQIKVSKKRRQFFDLLVSPVMLMLLYSEKNTAFSSIPKKE